MKRAFLAVALGALVASGCGPAQPVEPQFPTIDGQAILGHIKMLASDEFEGRAPGTKGEDLTVAYVAEQFQKLGLQPGNTDGTYIQKVPLVGITAAPATLDFAKGSRHLKLAWKDDVVAWTKHVADTASIDKSDVVFVGYGVVAPEYNWDDYKGLDVKGKTLIMLVNDPPVPDPAVPEVLDKTVFGGPAMTYYGRWTYKYEIGAEKGAAGVILVHETGPAGYPFSVVQGKTAENFDLVTPDKNMGRCAVEGWITLDKAKALFKMAGQDFDTLKAAAVSRDFKPVPLGVKASMTIKNTLRTIDSRNVVAKLEGSDPALKNEYITMTSHWDHFGIGDPDETGDKIYNGAYDNASGVAALLEIAHAFTQVQPPPKRTIVFLAVTAEEQGLLGSGYYAAMPIYPLDKTLADINMDGMNMYGPTKDVIVVGLGASDLDDYAQEVAAAQGRVIVPDQEPEKGFYYRSDHFPFAKAGVPALDASSGEEYVDKPEGWGKALRAEYTAKHYHQPSDEVQPDWVTTGVVQDSNFYLKVAYKVAQADKYPEWKPGNEFKAKRDAMLKK
jgi:Zn-dependent M28 family amino/carboxypeptidase